MDTRTIQDYLGHKSIQHTVKYTSSRRSDFEVCGGNPLRGRSAETAGNLDGGRPVERFGRRIVPNHWWNPGNRFGDFYQRDYPAGTRSLSDGLPRARRATPIHRPVHLS